jgi:hypothetical protein
MAFFDFDRRIQTLLIAGALASLSACGGSTSLDGGTDTRVDGADERIDWVVDPAPDMIDPPADTGPDAVDPAPDMLDGPLLCPDPDTWGVSIANEAVAWPIMTIRVTLDIAPEYIHESDPVFTAEKKDIVDVRMVSANQYDVDYRWEGALEHEYWDWDRFNVSWRVRCTDDFGSYESTVTDSQILCVDGGWLWFAWGSDPDSCMVVDCVPDTMDTGTVENGSPTPGQPPALPRGALQTSLRAFPANGGAIRLEVAASGPASGSASFSWTASAGKLSALGSSALWLPPREPGVHTVQVTTSSGNALSVNVYRKITKA